MTASATIAWVLAVLLAGFGTFGFYRSLFADRSRGRRRCPKCWYEMTGVGGTTCPECGRTAARERRLFRTRRHRWRAVAFAALVLLGVCLPRTERIRREGWSAVPRPVFIAAALFVGQDPKYWALYDDRLLRE